MESSKERKDWKELIEGTLFYKAYRVLALFGVLHEYRATDSARNYSWARVIIGYTVHTLMLIRSTVDFFIIRTDMSKATINACISVLVGGILIRNLIYIVMQNNIMDLFVDMMENKYFKRGEPETEFIFHDFRREVKRIGYIFLLAGAFGVPLWLMMPFIGEEFELPFRSWFPFEIKKYPNFYYAYGIQMSSIGYIGVSIVGCDLMAYNVILLIRAHYRILIKSIRDVGVEVAGRSMRDEKNFNLKRIRIGNQFKHIVTHHYHVLSFVKRFVHAFNFMLFIQLIGGAFLITLFCIEMLTSARSSTLRTKFLPEVMLSSGCLFTMFMYCLLGSAIDNQSEEVSRAVYGTGWHSDGVCCSEMKHFVLLMTIQCNKAPRIKAGKVVSCSLPVFLSIVEKIYDAMAVFPQLFQKYISGQV